VAVNRLVLVAIAIVAVVAVAAAVLLLQPGGGGAVEEATTPTTPSGQQQATTTPGAGATIRTPERTGIVFTNPTTPAQSPTTTTPVCSPGVILASATARLTTRVNPETREEEIHLEIFIEVRKNESVAGDVVLKQILIDSDKWGEIRRVNPGFRDLLYYEYEEGIQLPYIPRQPIDIVIPPELADMYNRGTLHTITFVYEYSGVECSETYPVTIM